MVAAVEELNATLFRMLKDELDSLSIGHAYNLKRINAMKEICHLLAYYKYVDMSSDDIMKLVKFYEY